LLIADIADDQGTPLGELGMTVHQVVQGNRKIAPLVQGLAGMAADISSPTGYEH
jgi:hypothetical protein